MALQVFPKSGDIVAADFAQALDRVSGGHRATTGLDFSLSYLSLAGGNTTWRLNAGSYIFNGYVFVADGTETITAAAASTVPVYLYYTLTGGFITAAGLSTNAGAGTARIQLWTVQGPVTSAPATVKDYRRINTLGRTAYANTDADAITMAAPKDTMVASGWCKQFRVAYPGSYSIAFEYIADGVATLCYMHRIRGGVNTQLGDLPTVAEWTAYSSTINDCLPGDIIGLLGVNPGRFRSAYLRYKLTDPASPAVLLD